MDTAGVLVDEDELEAVDEDEPDAADVPPDELLAPDPDVVCPTEMLTWLTTPPTGAVKVVWLTARWALSTVTWSTWTWLWSIWICCVVAPCLTAASAACAFCSVAWAEFTRAWAWSLLCWAFSGAALYAVCADALCCLSVAHWLLDGLAAQSAASAARAAMYALWAWATICWLTAAVSAWLTRLFWSCTWALVTDACACARFWAVGPAWSRDSFAWAADRLAWAWVRVPSRLVGTSMASTSPALTACPACTLTACTLPDAPKSSSVWLTAARFPEMGKVWVTVPRTAAAGRDCTVLLLALDR